MILVAGAFALLYLGATALIARLERSTVAVAVGRYTPSLIPIAAVYFAAHYMTYLVLYSQLTPGVVADPFEREWVPDYAPWSAIPSAAAWWTQVVLIVSGHVIAVFQAHRIARRRPLAERAPLRTLAAHSPLTAIMVCYTAIGIWVLGQAIKAT